MKYLKIAAITLLVAATVVVAVAYLRRDSIARDIANAVLEGQDITVSDLSVNFIQADRIEFSEIVLRRADGTEIEISGLSFPLSFPSVTPEYISIEELRVKPATGSGEPARYGEILRTVLSLPDELPSTALTIERLSIPDMPTVTDIVWAVADRMQRLTLGVGTMSGLAEIEHSGDDAYRLTVQAGIADNRDVLKLEFDVVADREGFVLEGPAAVDITPLPPTLANLGILPADIELLNTQIAGPARIRVPDSGQVVWQSRLSASHQASASYRANDEFVVDVRLVESDPIELAVEFPSLVWSVNMQRLGLALNLGPVGNLPLQVGNVDCSSTVACGADLRIETSALQLPGLEIGRVDLAASVTISTTAPLVIDVAEELVLNLSELKSAALAADSIETDRFSGARFSTGNNNWRATAGTLELTLNGFTDGKNLSVTSPASFTNIRVENGAASARADVSIPAGTGTLRLRSFEQPMPGIDGEVSNGDEGILGVFDLSDGNGALGGKIRAAYDTSAGDIDIAISDTSLSFDRRSLSARLTNWPYDWDLVAGTWVVDATLSGTTDDYAGSMTHTMRALAGHYGEVAFTGIGGDVTVEFDSSSSFTVPPATLEVALLDVGLPLEKLSAAFSVDNSRMLHVDTLSMSALGGEVTVDAFQFSAGERESTLLVRPQSVQLQFMADLAGFEAVELSGSLSGVLPVSMKDNKITITGGVLENDPPGGVIRYRSGTAIEANAPQTGLGIATTALANFEFDSLHSDVNYSVDGDLTLQMRLSGTNPDYDATQPINLNLGVENNIPELLRSLQAIRSIEDVLERGTQN